MSEGDAPGDESSPLGVAPPAYRLPAATQLGRVSLRVADLERSIAYYRDVLGLQLLASSDGVASMGVAARSTNERDTALVELHHHPGASPVPRSGRLGLFHFAILLPNRAELGRFLEHLASLGVYAGMSDHDVSEALYLSDPDGLGIEVYADRPRSTWRHDGRQLHMTTAPLDVGDLRLAAGETPWRGIPPGTRMGHVHLRVSSLEDGAAFYHAALGFDLTVWGYPGALFLAAGGYHHHLGTNTWGGKAPQPGEHDARLLEWEIVLPSATDSAAAAESVRAAGYQVRTETDGAWIVTDPWTTEIRLRPAHS